MDSHYHQVMKARAQALADAQSDAPENSGANQQGISQQDQKDKKDLIQTNKRSPILYFAYSTILDRAAFEEWRNQHSYQFFELPAGQIAQAQNVSLVFDFPSRWWGGRAAGLVDDIGKNIYGLCFEIQPEDWPIIQHKEGFITGMCIEREVDVLIEGVKHKAKAFTTSPGRANLLGPISSEFVKALLRGAESSQLPEDYINYLKTLLK